MGSSGSAAAPPGTKKVDIYFLSDSTGSMGSQLDSVKKDASSILEKVRATGADVWFGVGNYKDFSDGGKAFIPQQGVTADLESVTAAISEWQAGGGGKGDIPEAQLYALDQLATARDTIGWRPGAQRIVVWFGDAPGHDPICKAISGLSYDITEESVTRKLKDQRIRVVALSTPSGLDHDPRVSAPGYVSQCGEPGGRPGQASRIAAATGGSHTSDVGDDAIADTIIEQVHTQISTAPLRGPLLSWGAQAYGALGGGPAVNRNVAVEVDGDLTDITSLAAGYYSSAVALADGTVRTWGLGDWGQLGDGATTSRTAPVEALDVDGVRCLRGRSVAVSWHMVAIRDDAAWSWGANNYGQLGDGTTHGAVPTTRRKTLATGLTAPREVAAGEHHSLALDADGTVWAWGDNTYGQLGTGDNKPKDRPTQVRNGIEKRKITAIAAGWNFSLALDEDGTVWAWGRGWCGVLGNGKDESNSSTPARVKGVGGVGHLKHVTAIFAGYAHSLALLDDGTVAAWGTDIEKQGGYDEGGTHHTPKKVYADSSKSGELTGVTALAAGWYHSVALMEDGTVAAWGLNDGGQLGDGTNTQRPTPVKVKDPRDKTKELSGVRSVAAGWKHSIAACDWPSD